MDIQTLVDLVVTKAKVDPTSPDPSNLRNGWRTDALLIGDIDALVVGKHNDPRAYAEIGRQILQQVEGLPEIAALARLAILRGERLLLLTSEREQDIVQFSRWILESISALPDGTRKMRCRSLFEYNMGIFYEASGRYDLAADAHLRAAQEAECFGDRAGAAISNYGETFNRLRIAVLKGLDSESVFVKVEERFAELAQALRGSTLEVQWVEGNCPGQMIEVCSWLDRTHSRWDEWVATAVAAEKKLGAAWKPGADFVKAADMDKRRDPQASEALRAASQAGANEIRATAILLLARRAVDEGRISQARTIVSEMPVSGAQHVRAVADRMLAQYVP